MPTFPKQFYDKGYYYQETLSSQPGTMNKQF